VVVTPDSGPENLEIAQRLRGEDVAMFVGTVTPRLEGKANEKLCDWRYRGAGNFGQAAQPL
jgi:hypothetical protein